MAASAPATTTLAEAFDKLKSSVRPDDAVRFQSTSLQDVWKAARDIERSQQQRQSLRNLRRIEPLLNAIGKYSKVIEVLCNGTPFLPWIWAPIKLMLQLASEYTSIFDKLVTAYAQIAEALPRFDRFEEAFKDHPTVQEVLAVVYADILEFHRRAYKFFRCRAWHIVFNSLWKDFAARFNGILESLARHTELVDKEALSISIVEARSWRKQAHLDLEKRELDRQAAQFKHAVTWLDVDSRTQEDDLDRLSRRRGPGTCDWILKVPRMISWLSNANDEPVLWLRGIPGAGKSVLCSRIIGYMQEEQQVAVAYYFCSSHSDSKDLCSQILRCLGLQLLRRRLDLASYVCENYANRGLSPSMEQLRNLLPELLDSIPSIRIIIDGLDECQERLQKTIMQELLSMFKSSDGHCKILFSSREGIEIRKALRKKQYISLRDEKKDVDTDIQLFTHQSLVELRERFSSTEMDNIETKIVEKANGMFLWVRLVVVSLEDCYSIKELQDAARKLPEGLNKAYDRILSRIQNEYSHLNSHKAIRILEWMAYSFRALKVWEIQDGIVYQAGVNTVLDDETKLPKSILEVCRPMVEEGPGSTVDFVHFSAKEYMLDQASGPFLQEKQAQYHISFSCVAYLSTTSCFIDPSVPESQLRRRIVKGYHGLHLYANEFWAWHLLEYLKSQNTLDVTIPPPLIKQLQSLCAFRKDAQSAGFHAELQAMASLQSIETRTTTLDSLPDTKGLVQDILAYREILAQEKHNQKSPEDFQEYELEIDPTYFSEVLRRYQEIVELLLDLPTSELLEGVDQEDLDSFRRIYMDSSYVCRYRQCPRASNGFRSRKDRETHESLHVKRFKCADTTCDFYIGGFATKNALRKHEQRYHTKPDEKEVPKFPQEASKIPDETRREDPINASHILQTIPSGQAFPTHFVPIRPDEIIVLPFLGDSLRQYYSDLAQNCWDVIEKPSELRKIPYFDPSTAQEQLCDLTRKLRREMLVDQEALDIRDVGNDLSKLKLSELPVDLKKEEVDWHAVFNPRVPRILDVSCLEILEPSQALWDVAFSQDGRFITTSDSYLVRVFDVFTGGEVCRVSELSEDVIECLCFGPDGKSLVTGSQLGHLRIWDLKSQQIKYSLIGHTRCINEVVWSKEGSTIASAGEDGTICLWDPDTRLCRLAISTEARAWRVAVSSDGRYFAAGGSQLSVCVWDCKSGLLITQYNSHVDEINSVAFSLDGETIISGSMDGNIKIWAFDGTPKSILLASLTGHASRFPSVQFTQDAAWILSNSRGQGLNFWNTRSGDLHAHVVGHRDYVEKLACSPTNSLFATAGQKGQVRIWSYDKYQPSSGINLAPISNSIYGSSGALC